MALEEERIARKHAEAAAESARAAGQAQVSSGVQPDFLGPLCGQPSTCCQSFT